MKLYIFSDHDDEMIYSYFCFVVYNMSEVFTPLCDVDPMSERIKVKARCVSIRRSHAPGKPTPVWSLDCVIQDEQVI